MAQYCDLFQAWGREIEAGQASLNSTVLVRHPETKCLHVNFDRKVMELLRDIQVMRGLGIEVPSHALTVYSQKAVIMERYNNINVRKLCTPYRTRITCASVINYPHLTANN